MSDDDYYTDSIETNATTSYAQVVVPGFNLVGPARVDGDTDIYAQTITGNSFLRLGAYPVSIAHANNVFTMTTDTTKPTGFDTSLALAKLIGNMDGSTGIVATEEATADTGTAPLGYFTTDPFAGDKVIGFADDTRIRDDAGDTILYLNGAKRVNSPANRRTETYRLLSKGGWWDHSDGNRVSTTVGDKIEVIQGNYKLLVLGRRDGSEDKRVTDVSGGYEFSKTYEYLTTERVWATYEKSSTVNATKVTSGKDVSYFKGSFRKTVIGKHPDDTEERPRIESETYASSTKSSTEADNIESYTGKDSKPVKHQIALTYCLAMEDIRFGVTMQDIRFFTEHTTARSAAILLGVNLGLINITDLKAAPILSSFSITKLKYTFDIAPVQFESKLGVDLQYATKRVQVVPDEQKASVLRTDLNAAVQSIATLRTDLNTSNTSISNTKTNVQNLVTELGNQNVNLAALHLLA